jgi:phenylacetic acid degradation protein PaaD
MSSRPDDVAPGSDRTIDRPGAQDRAERSAAAMWTGDAASQALGIVIDGVTPGHALALMTVTAAMVNGHGIAHGGYVFLLADTAFAFACNTYGVVTVARGADITFVSPAREGDVLEAVAQERHREGRNGIYDVTVRRRGGSGGDSVVAEFRGHSRESRTPLVD